MGAYTFSKGKRFNLMHPKIKPYINVSLKYQILTRLQQDPHK